MNALIAPWEWALLLCAERELCKAHGKKHPRSRDVPHCLQELSGHRAGMGHIIPPPSIPGVPGPPSFYRPLCPVQ